MATDEVKDDTNTGVKDVTKTQITGSVEEGVHAFVNGF